MRDAPPALNFNSPSSRITGSSPPFCILSQSRKRSAATRADPCWFVRNVISDDPMKPAATRLRQSNDSSMGPLGSPNSPGPMRRQAELRSERRRARRRHYGSCQVVRLNQLRHRSHRGRRSTIPSAYAPVIVTRRASKMSPMARRQAATGRRPRFRDGKGKARCMPSTPSSRRAVDLKQAVEREPRPAMPRRSPGWSTGFNTWRWRARMSSKVVMRARPTNPIGDQARRERPNRCV
jgi:hypothetical protein